MVAVINHLHLSKPVDEFVEPLEKDGLAVLSSQPGFHDFYFVKTADDRATVIILWEDGKSAANGAQVFGPTWFAKHIAPHLASEQERRMGEVVVAYRPK